MEIRTSVKSVMGAAALTTGVVGLMTHAGAILISGSTPQIINGTSGPDSFIGGPGNDTITMGKGADWIYDPWGKNTFKFYLGDVPGAGGYGGYGGYGGTDTTIGSGNDRAEFYFPIKGRVYLCGGAGYGGLPTIVVYDYNGGRYQLNGVRYLYEITPLGPRSVNYLEAPPDPACGGYGGPA